VLQENIALCSTFPWSIFQIQVNPGTYACIAGKEYMPHALYNGQTRLKRPVEVILSPYHQYTRLVKWRLQVSTMIVAYCVLNAVMH
jgi:hypothetical protein